MTRRMRCRWFWIVGALLLACEGGAQDESSSARPPAQAGAFYPAQPGELEKTVDGALDEAPDASIEGEVVGIVSPHAGYVYCADTMACAFRPLKGKKYDIAIILGSPHIGVSGACLYDGRAFATPLGEVPVDREMVKALEASGEPFLISDRAHAREHCIETQLPFLLRTVGKCPIVAMTVTEMSPDTMERAGREIARAVGDRKALLICSTDLTHFPPYDDAKRIDLAALEAVATMDPLGIQGTVDRLELEPVRNLSCVACGKGALLVTVAAAKYLGADEGKVLRYRNSGDVRMGDKSRVVGYGAVVFTDRDGKRPTLPAPGEKVIDPRARVRPPEKPLNDEQKRILLKIARESLEAAVKNEQYVPSEVEDPSLNEHRGSFVTLTKSGQLRGCLGVYTPKEPLYKVVADRARASALEDPRFSRVTPEELPDIDIEISALTPLEKVKEISEIEVGRDGLYIQQGSRAGTLLPQVASERGWDRETFLAHTCMKARLPIDAWKQGATIYRYAADVFGEKE